METATLQLRDVVSGATAEDLQDVLLALEGRVVELDAVRDSLATLRQARPGSTTPLPAPAKRARHGDDNINASSSSSTVAPDSNAREGGLANASRAAKDDSSEPVAAAAAAAAADSIVQDGGLTDASRAAKVNNSGPLAAADGEESLAGGQSARGLFWTNMKRDKQKKHKQQQQQQQQQQQAAARVGKGRKKRKGQERGFDHSRWRRRTVAVQLMYEGQNYAGFCSQGDGNEDTIEKHLFHALTTTKLVDRIAAGDNYSRCGRTDRGVSALGNVITVSTRSQFPKNLDVELPTSPLGSLRINKYGGLAAENTTTTTTTTTTTKAAAKNAEVLVPVGNTDGTTSTDAIETLANGHVIERTLSDVAREGGVVQDGGGDRNGDENNKDVIERSLSGVARERGFARDGGGEGNREGGSSNGNTQNEARGAAAATAAAAAAAAVAEVAGDVKTKAEKNKTGNKTEKGEEGVRDVTESDYCGMLNRVLPPEIRALAWAPVTEGFSARFSCSDRTYRYFFLERDLDIKAMDNAASRIVGDHDFRNLCKIDVANVSNFVRHIKHASVKAVPSPSQDYAGTEYYRICMFEVCGQAFLWHMVRCLMSVLFMVGRGLEPPDIMSFLLDLERCPAKPHYDMAPDGPLLLHACRFRSLQFQYTPENLYCLQAHLENLWEAAAIKAARLLNNLDYLAGMRIASKDLAAFADFKRAMKGSNAEHYSVRDHGKEGRRREQELKRQDQEHDRADTGAGSPTTNGHGDAMVDAVVDGFAEDGGELSWREGLARLRLMGLGPGQVLGRKGHMPMAKRQQGLPYEELVKGLGGKKRERLNRHLAMKTAGQESGEADAFYDSMQLQGVAGDEASSSLLPLAPVSSATPDLPPSSSDPSA